MNRKRMALVINPISGAGGDKTELANAIVEYLGQNGIDVIVHPTTGPGDAGRLARQAIDNGFQAVLACGGDGTVNETASAMLHTRVPMGIIPNGSGNGLARHLSIPVDPMLSLATIVKGNTEDCDCGTVNGRPFFCTFGVGYDAAVARRFANSGQRGKISYIRSAVEEFLHYTTHTYSVRADGHQFDNRAFLIAVCNASQYGNNAYIAPKASITDGLLDVTIIRKATPVETSMITFDLAAGTINRNRLVSTMRVRRIEITRSSSGPVHLDGEPLQMGRYLDVVCKKGALRLFTPADRADFRPLITPAEDILRDAEITIGNLLGRAGNA